MEVIFKSEGGVSAGQLRAMAMKWKAKGRVNVPEKTFLLVAQRREAEETKKRKGEEAEQEEKEQQTWERRVKRRNERKEQHERRKKEEAQRVSNDEVRVLTEEEVQQQIAKRKRLKETKTGKEHDEREWEKAQRALEEKWKQKQQPENLDPGTEEGQRDRVRSYHEQQVKNASPKKQQSKETRGRRSDTGEEETGDATQAEANKKAERRETRRQRQIGTGEWHKKVVQSLTDEPTGQMAKTFKIQDGQLYKKGDKSVGSRLVIPENMRTMMLQGTHEEVHRGNKNASQVLLANVWWSEIKRDLRRWKQECRRCQQQETKVERRVQTQAKRSSETEKDSRREEQKSGTY
jgi:hypothetical protein